MKKHRVVILTEIMSPYRVPVFNILSEDPNIELDVLFFAEAESRREWRISKKNINFNHKVIKGIIIGRSLHDDPISFNYLAIIELIKGRYDTIIVGGYHHPTNWFAFIYACITRKRLVLYSETTLENIRSKNLVKEQLKRLFVKHSTAFFVPGTPQRRYLVSLGAKQHNIKIAPNAVDTELFKKATQVFKGSKEEAKKKLGIRGDVLLYVGSMIDAKGVQDLIRAFSSINKNRPNTNLVLVGEGPDRKKYESICRDKGIKGVKFTGFKDQEDLPNYYASADIFVFPTYTDAWGLVINEAMLSGLPIVCSARAGAAEDLVKQDENGFIYNPGDIEAIRGYILRLLENKKLTEYMGKRSREIIANYTPEKMALGIKNAVFAE